MIKSEVLNHLRTAKSAHKGWVDRAKLLVHGLEIKEDAIPMMATQCKFGQWFYEDGQMLNACKNNPPESMSEIEHLHSQLHDIYLGIYKIYYASENKGFFSKLLGIKRKVSEAEKDIAKTYFHELEGVSHKLLDELNRLERRISATSEEDIAALS